MEAVVSSIHARSMLCAVLALNALACILFVAMYATRLPAMAAAKIAPQDAKHPRTALDRLPSSVRQVADAYNHIHEAPTVFFAACFATVLLGGVDATDARLAWAFVVFRGAHAAVQTSCNIVSLRFSIFALSWLVLGALIARGIARAAL